MPSHEELWAVAIEVARSTYQCARYGCMDNYIVSVVCFVNTICPSELKELPGLDHPIPPPNSEWCFALRLLREQAFLENIRRVPPRPPWHEYVENGEFDFAAAAEMDFTRNKVDQVRTGALARA